MGLFRLSSFIFAKKTFRANHIAPEQDVYGLDPDQEDLLSPDDDPESSVLFNV